MGGVAAGTRWIHHVRRLSAAKVSTDALERGQSRVIDASLTLIRERAKLKVLSLSLSPPISSSSCFAAILFLQVPLLF
jgi:arginase